MFCRVPARLPSLHDSADGTGTRQHSFFVHLRFSFLKWKIHQFMTFSGLFSSLKAFKPVLLFSALFLFAWSSHAANWYWYGLFYQKRGTVRTDSPVVKKVFFTSSNNQGDLVKWPWLADYSRYTESHWSWYIYFLPKYSTSNWPFAYSHGPSGTFSVPAGWDGSELPLIQEVYDKYPLERQAAIKAPKCYNTTENGETVKHIEVEFYSPGTALYGGIVVNDSTGNPYLAYPDSSGYCMGYMPDSVGTMQPVYYQNVNGQVVSSSAYETSQSVQLSYDSDLGQYSFESPDYSTLLADIRGRIVDLNQNVTALGSAVGDISVEVNPELTVNPTVTVPAPEVTVNVPAPQVTVNPTVTVPAPEVTVNVPAPEVTVNVTNSGVDVSDKLEASGTLQDIDDSQPQTSNEEQAILDVYTGWQTGVPGIAAECDIGLDTLIGPIPQMGSSLDVGQFSLGPYNITLSLTQYATIIAWFRAACLACLLVLFGYNLWNIITQSLQV